MSALSPVLRDHEGGYLAFMCPGCKSAHTVKVNTGSGTDGWEWNGNTQKPTFSPSVLVRSGHHAPNFNAGDDCWCKYNAACVARGEPPSHFKCEVCRSFVADGRIQFLADSTHELAGQTVDLPAWADD